MTSTSAKILILSDFVKARVQLRLEDIQEILEEQRSSLRQLDREVSALISKPHKLENIELCKTVSVAIESNLVKLFDWLEDENANRTGNSEDPAAKLLKQCEQLITRSERIKKTISDDMTACRYNQPTWTLTPVSATAFLIAGSVGVSNIFKPMAADKSSWPQYVGDASATVLAYIAFPRQANKAFAATKSAVSHLPSAARALRRMARNTIVAAGLMVTVASKASTDIQPRRSVASQASANSVANKKLKLG